MYLKLQGHSKNFSSKVVGSSLKKTALREKKTDRQLGCRRAWNLASRDVTDAKQMCSEDGSDDHRWLMSNLVWYAVVLQRLMIHLCASKAFFSRVFINLPTSCSLLKRFVYRMRVRLLTGRTLAARCCDWLLSAARWNSKRTNSLTGGFLIQKATKLCRLTVEGFFFTANQGRAQLWCGGGGGPYIKMQLALTSISVSGSVRVIIFWWIFPTVNMTEEMRKFGGDNLKFQPELERIIHFSCWGVLVFRTF